MTKIVGIDFGTVNVRIAQRDGDGETRQCVIGIGDNPGWMPAVIAFRKQPNGERETVVGEAADALASDPDAIVVRNIKRLATASDKSLKDVIEWYFEQKETSWDECLDPATRSIRLWDGHAVSSEEAMKLILKEAIARAGLAGEVAEWRAGCPVSSDLAYRKALIAALDELGCEGRVEWVVEEPLLLLALGTEIGSLARGELCMVYDLGGGSFDCAVARVEDGGLTVYANEGLPRGGTDIDRLLKQAGIDWNDERVSEILEDDGFVNETLMAMLNAYHKANNILKLPEDEGEHSHNLNWSGGIESMIADIDKFLITGGPTESPYFLAKLEEALGESGAEKMMTADDLVETVGITYMEKTARITALSHGACYMVGNQYFPVSVDRVPATITLTVSDGSDTDEYAYEAFSRMPYRDPSKPHEGRWVALQSDNAKVYRVVVENADGVILYDSDVVYDSEGQPLMQMGRPMRLERPMRMPRDGYLGPVADRAKLVIDRFGSVWVRLAAGSPNVPQPAEDEVVILRNPIWQTGLQKEVMEKLEEIQRRREAERQAAITRNLNPKPYNVP